MKAMRTLKFVALIASGLFFACFYAPGASAAVAALAKPDDISINAVKTARIVRLSFLCFKNGQGGLSEGEARRPTRIKCDLDGHSAQFVGGNAVGDGTPNVPLQFLVPAKRCKDRAGDDAAVTRVHLRLFPDVAIEDVFTQAAKLRHCLLNAPTR